MEKIEIDFYNSDYIEMDDVLDGAYFSDDDLIDLEEDESYYEHKPTHES